MNMPKNRSGILVGLGGGLLWGLDTILIGIILSQTVFSNYLLIAPFIATFLHDTFSSIWLLLFTGIKGNFNNLKIAISSKSGFFVMIAALFGGPIGMTGYMLAIKYIGPSYTAVISSMYPAVGAFLSYLILKERMTKLGFLGLFMAIGSTIVLGLSANDDPKNILLGFLFAILCVLGWGCEAVICAYGMKNDILPEVALQLRQLVSAIIYGTFIIPLINGYEVVSAVLKSPSVVWLVFTALAGTISYLFYYNSINSLGAITAMGLNISYSAWAIFLGIFIGNMTRWTDFLLAAVIITGSILTTEKPKEFLNIFKFYLGNGKETSK